MNDHSHDHLDLIKSFLEDQKEIFESSDQAMYVFLDDDSRACNEKFAKLLGYASAAEWMTTDTTNGFPTAFVAEKSHATLISTYQDAMERKVAATINVTWKKKQGGTVKTSVILLPILYQGHLLALHFVS